MEQLEIKSQVDSWRLSCPRGHRDVGPSNDHWWCASCARHWENVEAEFETIRDMKTGRDLRRDQVRFAYDSPGVRHV